jgi:hypothetical protein
VEFFIREGGCLDLSTRAVGLYSIFTAPYFLLTVYTGGTGIAVLDKAGN